jgi:predicted DCC family thiol-disulfide oxidoreductase YuxK
MENESMKLESASTPPVRVHAPLMLYDGECALCTGSVNFVLNHDRNKKIQFASLQSAPGQALLEFFGLPTQDFESFMVVEDNLCFTKSAAVARLGIHMGGPWKGLGRASMIIPAFLNDGIYSFVFRNRIRWFGRVDSCRLPTPELQARMLDASYQ